MNSLCRFNSYKILFLHFVHPKMLTGTTRWHCLVFCIYTCDGTRDSTCGSTRGSTRDSTRGSTRGSTRDSTRDSTRSSTRGSTRSGKRMRVYTRLYTQARVSLRVKYCRWINLLLSKIKQFFVIGRYKCLIGEKELKKILSSSSSKEQAFSVVLSWPTFCHVWNL